MLVFQFKIHKLRAFMIYVQSYTFKHEIYIHCKFIPLHFKLTTAMKFIISIPYFSLL